MNWALNMISPNVLRFSARFISYSRVLAKVPRTADKMTTIKVEEKVKVPVETDTVKLAEYVCGTNLFVEGGQDIKIKPDSEYPEWLWTFRSPPPLEELDPNSKTYWNRIRRIREKERKHLNYLQRHKSVHK